MHVLRGRGYFEMAFLLALSLLRLILGRGPSIVKLSELMPSPSQSGKKSEKRLSIEGLTAFGVGWFYSWQNHF